MRAASCIALAPPAKQTCAIGRLDFEVRVLVSCLVSNRLMAMMIPIFFKKNKKIQSSNISSYSPFPMTDPRCRMSDDAAKDVHVSCPPGTAVSKVVFAGVGHPAGHCNNFTRGTSRLTHILSR